MKKNLKILLISLFIVILSGFFLKNYSETRDFELTVLHTNDIHGHLMPFGYKEGRGQMGGITRRATLVQKIRQNNKNVLLLDAGDDFQGTLYFSVFQGIPDINFMNQLNYDAMVLGNHEFDKGLGILKSIVQTAQFPILGANLKFLKDKELNDKIQPYIIKEFNGYKVGIIGVTTENLDTLVADFKDVKVLRNKTLLRMLVKQLNPKTDLIIVISHCGFEQDVELAKAVPDIDLIIGGHTHTYLKHPVKVNNTLIVQTGEFGLSLGKMDLFFNNKKITKYKYNLIPIKKDMTEDANIKSQLMGLNQELKQYTQNVIGEVLNNLDGRKDSIRKKQTTAGRLVVEAIKYKFPQADVVMLNSGSIRLHYLLSAGKITHADVLRLYPFDDSPVIAKIKGADIKSMLERSASYLPNDDSAYLQHLGLEYTVDCSKLPQKMYKKYISKEGQRVLNIKINNEPIDLDKYYTVATSNYVFGGGNYYIQFKNAIDVEAPKITITSLIIDYVKEKSPIKLNKLDNVKIINCNK